MSRSARARSAGRRAGRSRYTWSARFAPRDRAQVDEPEDPDVLFESSSELAVVETGGDGGQALGCGWLLGPVVAEVQVKPGGGPLATMIVAGPGCQSARRRRGRRGRAGAAGRGARCRGSGRRAG